jgi:hypothetical protein
MKRGRAYRRRQRARIIRRAQRNFPWYNFAYYGGVWTEDIQWGRFSKNHLIDSPIKCVKMDLSVSDEDFWTLSRRVKWENWYWNTRKDNS